VDILPSFRQIGGGGDWRVRSTELGTVTETEVLKQMTDFAKEETWYKHYVTGGHLNDVRPNTLQLVTSEVGVTVNSNDFRKLWNFGVVNFSLFCTT
jgi:hypothetical protein